MFHNLFTTNSHFVHIYFLYYFHKSKSHIQMINSKIAHRFFIIAPVARRPGSPHFYGDFLRNRKAPLGRYFYCPRVHYSIEFHENHRNSAIFFGWMMDCNIVYHIRKNCKHPVTVQIQKRPLQTETEALGFLICSGFSDALMECILYYRSW